MHIILYYLFSFLQLSASVLANTEIVNFSTEEQSSRLFVHQWPVLSARSWTLQMNVTSASLGSVAVCPEMSSDSYRACPWIELDLDDAAWRGFHKFTLRVSWPAFHPTDISINIFGPQDLQLQPYSKTTSAVETTRRKYARIQLIHTGVLTPAANPPNDTQLRQVPIILVLEPLHFGVLPSSVVPVLLAILAVVAIGLPISSTINRHLKPIAWQAREEGKVNRKHS